MGGDGVGRHAEALESLGEGSKGRGGGAREGVDACCGGIHDQGVRKEFDVGGWTERFKMSKWYTEDERGERQRTCVDSGLFEAAARERREAGDGDILCGELLERARVEHVPEVLEREREMSTVVSVIAADAARWVGGSGRTRVAMRTSSLR